MLLSEEKFISIEDNTYVITKVPSRYYLSLVKHYKTHLVLDRYILPNLICSDIEDCKLRIRNYYLVGRKLPISQYLDLLQKSAYLISSNIDKFNVE